MNVNGGANARGNMSPGCVKGGASLWVAKWGGPGTVLGNVGPGTDGGMNMCIVWALRGILMQGQDPGRLGGVLTFLGAPALSWQSEQTCALGFRSDMWFDSPIGRWGDQPNL
jgi:hypothetical protein